MKLQSLKMQYYRRPIQIYKNKKTAYAMDISRFAFSVLA